MFTDCRRSCSTRSAAFTAMSCLLLFFISACLLWGLLSQINGKNLKNIQSCCTTLVKIQRKNLFLKIQSAIIKTCRISNILQTDILSVFLNLVSSFFIFTSESERVINKQRHVTDRAAVCFRLIYVCRRLLRPMCSQLTCCHRYLPTR